MINILEKCFGDKLQKEWRDKLLEMVPTYGRKLKDSAELTDRVRNYTKKNLNWNTNEVFNSFYAEYLCFWTKSRD